MTKKNKITIIVVIILILLIPTYLIFIKSPSLTDINNELTKEDTPSGNLNVDESLDTFRNTPEDEISDNSHNSMDDLSDMDYKNNLPDVIFNISGEVIQMGSDFLIIQTKGLHTQEGEPVEVRVNLREEMMISDPNDPGDEILVPKTIILDANNNEVSLSSIEMGKNLYIESNENLKDKMEIEASSIRIK
ncbi:MAG: hypothetical protein WD512_18195 [Candidatus Paceibacterota bacterium]